MELGSEYNLDLNSLAACDNNVYKYLNDYYGTCFDSGRSALKALIKFLTLQEGARVLLPEYICESVIKCFDKFDVIFYKINEQLTVDIDDLRSKCSKDISILFIMNYYGKLQSNETMEEIKKLKKENDFVIIEDTTHSIFSAASTVGDYMISSIRKWIPIPKAGILYGEDSNLSGLSDCYKQSTDNRKIVGMVLKDLYLKESLDCNTTYREIFESCEREIDNQEEILNASDMSEYIAGCIDINDLINKRQQNYNYLREKLNNTKYTPINNLSENECPFSYVIFSANRDKLRKYLMDNKIYCAVHWPLDGIRMSERKMAQKAGTHYLSLPIDQRYSKEHLDYMVEILLAYKEV